jgi:hypothetical protein
MSSPFYIPEPCHESWNKMSTTEKGRYCQVCTKEVVDFTSKSQPEIVNILQQSQGNTCGRFKISQLNVPVQHEVLEAKKSPVRKWIISTLAMIGLMGWFKESKAQKGKVAIRGEVAYIESHNLQRDTTIVHGTVSETNRNVLAGAEVSIYCGTKLVGKTRTISNGTYRIAIPPGVMENNKISVHVEAENFQIKEVNDFTVTKAQNRVNVVMEEEYILLGDTMYIPENIEIEETEIEKMAVMEQDTAIDSTATIIDEEIEIMQGQVVANFNINSELICETGNIEVLKEDDKITIEKIPGLVIPGDSTAIEPEPENNLPGIEPGNEEEDSSDEEKPSTQLDTDPLAVIGPELVTTVYPNPTTDFITIETGTDSKFIVRVFDINGQLVEEQNFSGNKTRLDVQELVTGNYLVEVMDIASGKKSVVKIVKS